MIVTTYTPQEITDISAKCGGDVIVPQGLSLNGLGVCWSNEAIPTVEDTHLYTSDWHNPFVCTLSGLNPGTVYYVRAYVLRGLEYYYGDEKSFTTEDSNYPYNVFYVIGTWKCTYSHWTLTRYDANGNQIGYEEGVDDNPETILEFHADGIFHTEGLEDVSYIINGEELIIGEAVHHIDKLTATELHFHRTIVKVDSIGYKTIRTFEWKYVKI